MKNNIFFFVKLCIAVFAMASIVGCASQTSMYSACDQKNSKFSEVAACTKQALKADSRYSFHNGYISYANRTISALDVMDEKIAAGQMTEREARYNMLELLASQQREITAQVNAIDASIPANKTTRTTCSTIGSSTVCKSR